MFHMICQKIYKCDFCFLDMDHQLSTCARRWRQKHGVSEKCACSCVIKRVTSHWEGCVKILIKCVRTLVMAPQPAKDFLIKKRIFQGKDPLGPSVTLFAGGEGDNRTQSGYNAQIGFAKYPHPVSQGELTSTLNLIK